MTASTSNTSSTSDARSAADLAAHALAAAASVELGITDILHAGGALFNVDADRLKKNGPVMTGALRDEHGVSVPVSAFRQVAEETGVIYLSLAIGGRGKPKMYGKLFRRGKFQGEGPVYSGFIVVLPVSEGEQHTKEAWASAPRLQVFGWRRRSADATARISLSIAPRLVREEELAF